MLNSDAQCNISQVRVCAVDFGKFPSLHGDQEQNRPGNVRLKTEDEKHTSDSIVTPDGHVLMLYKYVGVILARYSSHDADAEFSNGTENLRGARLEIIA